LCGRSWLRVADCEPQWQTQMNADPGNLISGAIRSNPTESDRIRPNPTESNLPAESEPDGPQGGN